MTGPFSARRRADEFEALSRRRPETPLTDARGRALRGASQLVSRPARRARGDAATRVLRRLRERLMTEADTVLLPQPSSPLAAAAARPCRLRGRDRRAGRSLLGGAAIVGATASMAVAAQTALPGESLYPRQARHRELPRRLRRRRRGAGPRPARQRRGRLDRAGGPGGQRRPVHAADASPTPSTRSPSRPARPRSLLTAYAETGSRGRHRPGARIHRRRAGPPHRAGGQVPESARTSSSRPVAP